MSYKCASEKVNLKRFFMCFYPYTNPFFKVLRFRRI